MPDLERTISAIKGQLEYFRMSGQLNSYVALVLTDALKLLKKQKNSRLTPMTPDHTKVEYADGHAWITDECPRCNAKGLGTWECLLDRYAPFCRRCGQAISWSEYDNDEKKIDFEKYLKESIRLDRFFELKKEIAKEGEEMKTIGRDKIRGKPLEHKCYDAETVRSKHNQMYVFCRGYDKSKDCQQCKAFMPKEDYEREDFVR